MSKIYKLILTAVMLTSGLSGWSMNDIYDTICKNPYEDYYYTEHGLDTILEQNDPEPFTINRVLANGDILQLFVAPTYHITYPEFPEDTIFWCDNEPVPESEYGFAITELLPGTNTYSKTFKTIYGCDSTISVTITTLESVKVLINETLCDETTYDNDTIEGLPDGIHYTDLKPGDRIDTTYQYEGDNECGGVIIVKINVGMTEEYSISETTCDNEVYHEHGFNLQNLTPGELMHLDTTFINQYGCDSILHVNLNVLRAKVHCDTIRRCREELPLTYNNFYIESHDEPIKTYTESFETVNECDSISILTVILHPIPDTTKYDTICYNEQPYYFGSDYIHETLEPNATYHFETTNYDENWCEGTKYLELTVMPVYPYEYYQDTACLNQQYTEHGFDTLIVDPGIHNLYAEYETKYGCDSIVRCRLTIVSPDTLSLTDNICDQDYYHEHGFHLDNLDVGIYYDTLRLSSIIYGCDSIVTLELHAGRTDSTTVFWDTICDGELYDKYDFVINFPPCYPGQVVYKTHEGDNTFYKHYTTEIGCDSVTCLHLYAWPSYIIALYPIYCYDTAQVIIPEDTTYPRFYKIAHGCDSIIFLEGLVGEPFYFRITDSICLGDYYTGKGLDTLFTTVGHHHVSDINYTVDGCDSIAEYDIYVMPVYDIKIYDTTCQNEPYNKYNFDPGDDIFYPGTYTYTNSSHTMIQGCDSVTTLELLVAPMYYYTYNYEYCDSVHFTELGFDTTFIEPGHYTLTDSLLTLYGCDSIIYVSIDVFENKDTLIFDTGCLYQEYREYGFKIIPEELGTLYDTSYSRYTASYNTYCDSTVYLQLEVFPQYDIPAYDTICYGENYDEYGLNWTNVQWNGAMPPYDITFPSVNGCDSTIWLQLYVYPVYDTIFRDTIDLGSDYHGYGFDTINPPFGIHYLHDSLQSISLCDSIVHLELHVVCEYDTRFTDTTCFGVKYQEHGFDIDNLEVGLKYDTLYLQSIYGRDSTVYLELYVAPIYDTTFYDTICYEQEYHEHGFDFWSIEDYELGMNYDTLFLTTVLGCDSTVYLELYVASIYDTMFQDTICYGQEYQEHGFNIGNLNSSGTHYDTLFLQTDLYCDSVVRLELYVAPVYDTILFDTICYGEEYHEHGFNLDDSDNLEIGMNYDTLFLHSIYGCDSIVKLQLLVGAVYDTTIKDTVCFGNGYHGHGFDLDSIAVGWNYKTIMLESVCGCDSVVRLELLVNPIYNITLGDTICEGETYNNYGFVYNNPDSLNIGMNYSTLSLSSVDGCDSIVTMNLLVGPLKHEYYIDSTCQNVPYNNYGFYYLDSQVNTEGFVMEHYNDKTFLGCDSLTTLTLYVYPVHDDVKVFDTVCNGEEYHLYGFNSDDFESFGLGMNYDTLFLLSRHGCDSTVFLELYMAPIYDTTFRDSICFGDEYHGHGFEINSSLLEVGMNYDTLFLKTIYGCDSIVMLELYVKPIYGMTFQDTICDGNEYHLHGFDYNGSDDYVIGMNYDTLFLVTTSGCDSVVNLELYIAQTYNTIITDTICHGQGYHENGFDLDDLEVGMTYDTLFLETALSCDSVVKLQLLVGAVYDTTLYDTACVNGGYHQHGFELGNLEVGMNYDTLFLNSVVGCDSVVMLELYAAPVYTTDFTDTVCFGDEYHGNGFNFTNHEVGTIHDTLFLHTALGCDSLVCLELHVTPSYYVSLYDTICFTGSYSGYGFGIENLNSGNNYDTLYLETAFHCDSIVTLDLFVKDTFEIWVEDYFCNGESYYGYGFSLENPSPETYVNSLASANGCDSLVTLTLHVRPSYTFNVIDSICEGEDYTLYGLNLQNPKPGYYDTTSYFKTAMFGCDSIYDVALKVLNQYNQIEGIHGLSEPPASSDLICDPHAYYIDPIPGCTEYHWSIEYHWWDESKWIITPHDNICDIKIISWASATLSVWAGNMCDTVRASKLINSFWYSVGEEEEINVKIYPNPTNGYVNVESDDIEIVNVLSATGVVVKKFKFDREDLVTIDLGDLPVSVYVLEIVTQNGKCIRRVSKTGHQN